MQRTPQTHPTLAGRTLMHCSFNHSDEQQDWHLAAPREIPAGYRPYWRWVGEHLLEFGVEPIENSPALAPAGGDAYEGMSIEDLQTIAPQKGIKKARGMTRGDLVAALRTMDAGVKRGPAPDVS